MLAFLAFLSDGDKSFLRCDALKYPPPLGGMQTVDTLTPLVVLLEVGLDGRREGVSDGGELTNCCSRKGSAIDSRRAQLSRERLTTCETLLELFELFLHLLEDRRREHTLEEEAKSGIVRVRWLKLKRLLLEAVLDAHLA